MGISDSRQAAVYRARSAVREGRHGKLGKPIGIAGYKPYQSTGEDFLQNYLGMIGLPIELYPDFPSEAKTVLLTEQAKFDPDIVSKIKTHLEKGGNVVITSGLLKELQENGQGDVVNSWVGSGPNKTISHGDLASALGDDTLNQLASYGGMPREEVLSGLSSQLPRLVDSLTPHGRLMNDEEAARSL